MRIVFIGSPPFATEAFDKLLARSERPVGLVTAPDRRVGRGRKEAANPLAVAARRERIPLLQPEKASEPGFLREFAALRPDLGVVVSYGQILREEFLTTPREGCINLHASLLPRWRGASPIQAAILAGDRLTGVCLQRVVAELDAGAVLARRETPIGPRETAPELFARLATLGAELLSDFLDDLGDGPLPAGDQQDPEAVTVCRKIRKQQAQVDWEQPAVEVDRLVRAMAGWPVAETALPEGGPLKILAGTPLEEEEAGRDAPAGAVLEAGPRLVVRCGRGCFRIERLQRPGKAPLDAAEFLRGAAWAPGMRLGGGPPEERE